MPIEVFNRYEHKYLMNRATYKKVLELMDLHMTADKHNKDHKPYTIANVYYDTPDDYLIRTSLSKPVYKEKLRLRAYGVPDMDTKVFLEIKKKYNGIVNKRRSVLKLSEAQTLLQTGEIPEVKEYMNSQVLNEIVYFLSHYELLPKVYLAYDRIAYFEQGNPDLRISFDMNIRSRRYKVALEKGDFGETLLDGNTYLMEIKTSRAKPLWLVNMLTEYGIQRQSFSKYGTEFKNTINSVPMKQAI